MMAYQSVAVQLDEKIKKLADRGACPFHSLGIYVDHQGAVLLAGSKREMQVNNARSCLITMLEPFDAFEQNMDAMLRSRKAMERTVRPFDELDKLRLDAWKTVASLRPRFSYAPKPARTEVPCPTTLQGFIDSLSDSEDEDDVQPMLSIRDGRLSLTESPAQDTMPDTTPGEAELYQAAEALYRVTWTTSAEQTAVVVMLSVGSPLEELAYIHCHREERREALLCSRLPAVPDLGETVAIAAQMAQEGSLPSSSGPRARKAEFLKRCEAALKAKNPRAERDVKKVPPEDQRKIALALNTTGTDTLCSRCPKPAVASLEFSLAWLDGIPEPNADIKYFCANCKPSHAAVCSKCGRHDSLEHGARPLPPMQFMGVHVLRDIHCTACKTLAIAPMTLGEKRKRGADWLVEGVKRGAFRCIPPA